MNHTRRGTLNNFANKIQQLRNEVETLRDEEETCRDNIPENMQNTERYNKSDEAVAALTEVVDYLDSALESIVNAIAD